MNKACRRKTIILDGGTCKKAKEQHADNKGEIDKTTTTKRETDCSKKLMKKKKKMCHQKKTSIKPIEWHL